MFMWQPSYSEVPNVCRNATPLPAGMSSPSRQGTITAPESRSVTTARSSRARTSPRCFPSYPMRTVLPSSTSSNVTALPLPLESRTRVVVDSTRSNPPSNPPPAPALAADSPGQRTAELLSMKNHMPVRGWTSNDNEGLSSLTGSSGSTRNPVKAETRTSMNADMSLSFPSWSRSMRCGAAGAAQGRKSRCG